MHIVENELNHNSHETDKKPSSIAEPEPAKYEYNLIYTYCQILRKN